MKLSNKLKTSNDKAQAATALQMCLLHTSDYMEELEKNIPEYEFIDQQIAVQEVHDQEPLTARTEKAAKELDSIVQQFEQYKLTHPELAEDPKAGPTLLRDYRGLEDGSYRTSFPKNMERARLIIQESIRLGYKNLFHLTFISKFATITYMPRNRFLKRRINTLYNPKNIAQIQSLTPGQFNSASKNLLLLLLKSRWPIIDCPQNNSCFSYNVGLELKLEYYQPWFEEYERVVSTKSTKIWYHWAALREIRQMQLRGIKITQDMISPLYPDLEMLQYGIQKVCDFVKEKLEIEEENPTLRPINTKPGKPNHIRNVTMDNLYAFLTEGIGEKTLMGKMLKLFLADGIPHMKAIEWIEVHKKINARFTGTRSSRPVYDAIKAYNKKFNPKTDGLKVFLWENDCVQLNPAIIPQPINL